LKKKHNYKDLLVEVNAEKNKYLFKSVHDIVGLDVNRTPFVNNVVKNREVNINIYITFYKLYKLI